jgi:predicted CXXCH cytochrome family protein
MASSPDPPCRPFRARRAFLVLLCGCGVALAVAALVHGRRGASLDSASRRVAAVNPDAWDPRLGYSGPFRNVDPRVQYTGDESCQGCHPGESASYRKHPMGRSLAPIGAAEHRSGAGPASRFSAFDSTFEVVRRGKGLAHLQMRQDQSGAVVYTLELPVHYVIGSGSHGHSYLSERDGYLVQTPISYFSKKRLYDRSPGSSPELLPGRPITPECLFCHANRARHQEDTRNRYLRPVFSGHAIGCERCHGPAELHVREGRLTRGGLDPTIVHPGKIEPALREAICAQCHLAGAARVPRRGRGLYDFRPGMPLEAFWSIFVEEQRPGGDKAVSHVEQMHLSRCFQLSSGAKKLTCTSCHDAHQQAPRDKLGEYYRPRCLSCHQERSCTAPAEERAGRPGCIDCHMPPYSASDIPHTVGTDHRIVRRRDRPAPPGKEDRSRFPVSFYPENEDRDRDLGIALAQRAASAKGDRRRFAERADELLGRGLKDHPEDVPAWEAKGQALTLLGRPTEALEAFESALAVAPRREISLHGAALAAQERGDRAKALHYWRRAVEIDPWDADYRGNLALLLADAGAWDDAWKECRAWVRLDPGSVEGRKLLVRCLLRRGDRAAAQAEREKLDRLR